MFQEPECVTLEVEGTDIKLIADLLGPGVKFGGILISDGHDDFYVSWGEAVSLRDRLTQLLTRKDIK